MDVTSDDNKGVLDYFGVKAEDAPTIYLVVLKDQMLKYTPLSRPALAAFPNRFRLSNP